MNRGNRIWEFWNKFGNQDGQAALARLEEMQRQRHGRRLRRIVGDRMNPFTAMSDAEFVDRFRLRKESVNSIIQKIQEQLAVANDR
ncbi:hypothetical protein Hamer_G027574, partial [Homarus americanus]